VQGEKGEWTGHPCVSLKFPKNHGLTTCLENLEMPGILPKVGEMSRKKSVRESGQKLFNVSCIFASVQVFSSIQLVLYVNYAFIIMKSLCHILIIDNNTSTGMI